MWTQGVEEGEDYGGDELNLEKMHPFPELEPLLAGEHECEDVAKLEFQELEGPIGTDTTDLEDMDI